jgi:hypothetical protein
LFLQEGWKDNVFHLILYVFFDHLGILAGSSCHVGGDFDLALDFIDDAGNFMFSESGKLAFGRHGVEGG